tara:strand:+ start:542 stop:1336 length:795 start_codon:yes stop_codon:yes gene_type:complete
MIVLKILVFLLFTEGSRSIPTKLSVVKGASEFHNKMQKDALSSNFFSEGFQFRFGKNIDSVVVDIGLYNGIIKPSLGQHVIALEASLREATKFKLQEKCELLVNCTLIMAAVGDGTDKFVQLWESFRPHGSATITSTNPKIWPADRSVSVVPLVSLKSIIEAIPVKYKISKCKIDTNGNDALVLKSASNAIQRCEEVQVEVVEGGQGGPLHQHRAVVKILLKNGFQSYIKSRPFIKGQFNLNVFKRPNIHGSIPLSSVIKNSKI